MPERVKIIDYKGHEIVLLDLANLNEEEILVGLDEIKEKIEQKFYDPENSLVLVDITKLETTIKIIEKASKLHGVTKGKIKRLAIMGAGSKVVRVIANAFDTKFHIANTAEEAKEWLIKLESSKTPRKEQKRTYFIEHKGREIAYCDYSNIRDEGVYLRAVDETDRVVFSHHTDPKDNLTLINVTGAIITAEIIGRSSKLNAKIGGKDLLVAFVGITGIKRTLANAFSRKQYFADTIEEAKDWLVDQAEKREKNKEE
ncbi:hypothetical protein ACFLZ9_00245 [Patescibacteria group bacterium]